MSLPSGAELFRAAKALRKLSEPYPSRFVLTRSGMVEIEEWLQNNPLIDEAVDAANLAISEYYNGDRVWGERWLLTAYHANKNKAQENSK